MRGNTTFAKPTGGAPSQKDGESHIKNQNGDYITGKKRNNAVPKDIGGGKPKNPKTLRDARN